MSGEINNLTNAFYMFRGDPNATGYQNLFFDRIYSPVKIHTSFMNSPAIYNCKTLRVWTQNNNAIINGDYYLVVGGDSGYPETESKLFDGTTNIDIEDPDNPELIYGSTINFSSYQWVKVDNGTTCSIAYNSQYNRWELLINNNTVATSTWTSSPVNGNYTNWSGNTYGPFFIAWSDHDKPVPIHNPSHFTLAIKGGTYGDGSRSYGFTPYIIEGGTCSVKWGDGNIEVFDDTASGCFIEHNYANEPKDDPNLSRNLQSAYLVEVDADIDNIIFGFNRSIYDISNGTSFNKILSGSTVSVNNWTLLDYKGSINYRYDYSSYSDYAQNDVVKSSDDKYYICILANSSSDPHPPSDSTYWKLMVFNENELIYYGSTYYKCTIDNNQTLPTNGVGWSSLNYSGYNGKQSPLSNLDYSTNDLCIYNNIINGSTVTNYYQYNYDDRSESNRVLACNWSSDDPGVNKITSGYCMFNNCINLVSEQKSFFITSNEYSDGNTYIFEQITSLPSGIIDGSYMFNLCDSVKFHGLSSLPSGLLNGTCMFNQCEAATFFELTGLPIGLISANFMFNRVGQDIGNEYTYIYNQLSYNYRGGWSSSSNYAVNDIVYYESPDDYKLKYFICTTANRNNQPIVYDEKWVSTHPSGFWVKINKGEYDSTKTYETKDKVTYQGINYYCNSLNTCFTHDRYTPDESSSWSTEPESGITYTDKGTWSETAIYNTEDLVYISKETDSGVTKKFYFHADTDYNNITTAPATFNSNWKVLDFTSKDYVLRKLTTLPNTLVNVSYMFANCSGLNNLNMNNFSGSNLVNCDHMFYYSDSKFRSLTTLPSTLSYAFEMFTGCFEAEFTNLTALPNSLIDGTGMFNRCNYANFSNLTSLGNNLKYAENIFEECNAATFDVYVNGNGNPIPSSVMIMKGMFSRCYLMNVDYENLFTITNNSLANTNMLATIFCETGRADEEWPSDTVTSMKRLFSNTFNLTYSRNDFYRLINYPIVVSTNNIYGSSFAYFNNIYMFSNDGTQTITYTIDSNDSDNYNYITASYIYNLDLYDEELIRYDTEWSNGVVLAREGPYDLWCKVDVDGYITFDYWELLVIYKQGYTYKNDYDPSIIYDFNDIVYNNGYFWRSIQDDNIFTPTPSTAGEHRLSIVGWRIISEYIGNLSSTVLNNLKSLLSGEITNNYSSSTTYTTDSIVKYTNNCYYRSKRSNNLNHLPQNDMLVRYN